MSFSGGGFAGSAGTVLDFRKLYLCQVDAASGDIAFAEIFAHAALFDHRVWEFAELTDFTGAFQRWITDE